MSELRCSIRLFAALADAARRSTIDVTLPAGSVVDDIWAALAHASPALAAGLAPWRERVAIAVNERYVRGDAPLRHGDEVALIPPVSGG